MIVTLPDKNIELEFPDDMPLDQVRGIIREKIYGQKPAVEPKPWGYPETVGKALMVGQGIRWPQMLGKTTKFLAEKMHIPFLAEQANKMLGKLEEAEEYQRKHPAELLPPPGFKETVYEGIQNVPPSINALALGAAAGPLGPLATKIGVGTSVFTLFSVPEYTDFLEQAKREGKDPNDPKIQALAAVSGASEGGLELISDLIGLKIFGLIGKKTLTAPVKRGIMEIVKSYVVNSAKFGTVEIPQEAITAAIEAKARQYAGLDTPEVVEAMKQVIGPTAVATAAFALLGTGGAQAGLGLSEAVGEKTRPKAPPIEEPPTPEPPPKEEPPIPPTPPTPVTVTPAVLQEYVEDRVRQIAAKEKPTAEDERQLDFIRAHEGNLPALAKFFGMELKEVSEPPKVEKPRVGKKTFKVWRTTFPGKKKTEFDFIQRSAGMYVALDGPWKQPGGVVEKLEVEIDPSKIFDPNGVLEGTPVEQSRKNFHDLITRINQEAADRKLVGPRDIAKLRTEILQSMGYEGEAGWIDVEGGNRELVLFKPTEAVGKPPEKPKEEKPPRVEKPTKEFPIEIEVRKYAETLETTRLTPKPETPEREVFEKRFTETQAKLDELEEKISKLSKEYERTSWKYHKKRDRIYAERERLYDEKKKVQAKADWTALKGQHRIAFLEDIISDPKSDLANKLAAYGNLATTVQWKDKDRVLKETWEELTNLAQEEVGKHLTKKKDIESIGSSVANHISSFPGTTTLEKQAELESRRFIRETREREGLEKLKELTDLDYGKRYDFEQGIKNAKNQEEVDKILEEAKKLNVEAKAKREAQEARQKKFEEEKKFRFAERIHSYSEIKGVRKAYLENKAEPNSKWLTDGHYATKKGLTIDKKLLAKMEVGIGGVDDSSIQKIWEDETKKAREKLEIIGFLEPEKYVEDEEGVGKWEPSRGPRNLFLVPEGKNEPVYVVNADLYKVLDKLLKPDSIYSQGKVDRALILKRKGYLVGLLMPMRGEETIDIPTARKVARGEKPSRVLAEKEIIREEPHEVPSIIFRPIPEGRTRRSMIKKLEKTLEIPFRHGKFRQRALGIYKVKEQVIRLKKVGDVEVAAHEAGHHIQRLMGINTRSLPQEIKDMAYPGAKKGTKKKEGFAEFVRFYVINPVHAKRKAPNFYPRFEEELKKHPDIQDALITVRQAWEEWKSSPSVAKVASLIVRGSGEEKKRLNFNDVYTKLKDSLRPLQIVRDRVEKKGAKLRPREDPFILATLLRGWTRIAEQYLKWGRFQWQPGEKIAIKFTGPSLKEILEPVEREGRMELLDAYLVSKRAVNDPRILKGFSGILSQADFEQTIQELEPEFEEVAKKLYEYNDDLLTYLTDAGRISKDLADRCRKKNLFYVPFYRVMDANIPLPGTGTKKIGNLFNPIKRLKGSSRQIYSPTESVLYNTYAMMNAAERNRIGDSLINISRKPGMGWLMDKIPWPVKPVNVSHDQLYALMRKYGKWKETATFEEIKKEFEKVIDLGEKTDRPAERVRDIALEALRARGWTEAEANQILDRLKGAETPEAREKIIEKTIEKTAIFTILREFGLDITDDVVQIWKPNYRAGPNEAIFYHKGEAILYELDPDIHSAIMAVNPVNLGIFEKMLSFPARARRAGATRWGLEFGIRNPGRDQLTAWMQSRYGYTPYVDLMRGLAHILGRTEKWQIYNASGAAHASIVSTDRKYIHKNLRELLRRKGPGYYLKHPLEAFQSLTEFGEEATRMGEFLRALETEGYDLDSILKGAVAAREVTLDFQRIGTWGRTFNLLTAFWNANIEGVDKMWRVHRENPAKAFMKGFLGITLPTLALWWAQKDDPDYQELPEWRKVAAWNIKLPRPIMGSKFLPIPKPWIWGSIYGTIPEAFVDWLYTKDPDGMIETMKKVLESNTPGWFLVVPSGFEIFAELYANKSHFFDRPIVPLDKEDLEPYLQYSPYTSETLKLLARKLAKVPVVKEYVSPAKMEHLIIGLTASIGRLTLEQMDDLLKRTGVINVPPEPSMTLSDIPGIRAFAVRFPSAQSKSIEQFYRHFLKEQRRWESAKEVTGVRGYGLKVEGKSDRLLRMEMMAKTLSALRKEVEAVYKDPKMKPEEKRRELDRIYYAMINAARWGLGKPQISRKP